MNRSWLKFLFAFFIAGSFILGNTHIVLAVTCKSDGNCTGTQSCEDPNGDGIYTCENLSCGTCKYAANHQCNNSNTSTSCSGCAEADCSSKNSNCGSCKKTKDNGCYCNGSGSCSLRDYACDSDSCNTNRTDKSACDYSCNGCNNPAHCDALCSPVNGGWSDWSTCTPACDSSCTERKTCTNPAPDCGGASCDLSVPHERQNVGPPCCGTPSCNSWSDIKFGSCDSGTKWNDKDPRCFTNNRNVTFAVAGGGGGEEIRYGVVGASTDCTTLSDASFSGWQTNTGSLTISRASDGEFKVCIQRRPTCNTSFVSIKCGAMANVDTQAPGACTNGSVSPTTIRWTSEQNGSFNIRGNLNDNNGFKTIYIGCLNSVGATVPAKTINFNDPYYYNMTSVTVNENIPMPSECKTTMNTNASKSVNWFVSGLDKAGNKVPSACQMTTSWVAAEKPYCANSYVMDEGGENLALYYKDFYHGLKITYDAGNIGGSGWQTNIRKQYITSSGSSNVVDCGQLGSLNCPETVNINLGTTIAFWTHLRKSFSDGGYACYANPQRWASPGGTLPPNNNPDTSCTNTSCLTKKWGVCYPEHPDGTEDRQYAINTNCNARVAAGEIPACKSNETWKNPMKCHVAQLPDGSEANWDTVPTYWDNKTQSCREHYCDCVCDPPLASPLPQVQCLDIDLARISWTPVTGASSYFLRINKDPINVWGSGPTWYDPGDAAVVVNGSSIDRTIEAGKSYSINLQSMKPGESWPNITAPQNPTDVKNGVIFNCGGCPPAVAPRINSPTNSCYGNSPTSYQITHFTNAQSLCFPWDTSARIRNEGLGNIAFESLRSANTGVLTNGPMDYSFTSWRASDGPISGLPQLGTGYYSFMSTIYDKWGVPSTESSTEFAVDKSPPGSPSNLTPNLETCKTWNFNQALDSGCGGISKYRVQCNSKSDYSGTNYCNADFTTTNFDLGAEPCAMANIAANTTVYCRVYAVDGVGLTSPIIQNSCTVPLNCSPGAPSSTSVVSPMGTSSNPVLVNTDPILLNWNKSSDERTDAYNVGTWTLSGGSETLVEVNGIDSTSTTKAKPLYTPGITYKWQLQTINYCVGREPSAWSAPGYFVLPTVGPTIPPCVAGQPDITTIVSPLGSSTSPVSISGDTVVFRWNKSNDTKTDGYRIGVWAPNEEYIFDTWGVGTTSFGEPTATFGVGTTYHWQIQTLNSCSGTEPSNWSNMVGWFVVPSSTVKTSIYVRGRVWWDDDEDFMRRNEGSVANPRYEPMLTDASPNNFASISLSHNCGLNETMKTSLWNTCTYNDGVGPFTSSWISKSWVGGDCSLTAKIDTDKSPGWFFPEYTRSDNSKGPDFRRHYPSMIDYTGMPYDLYDDACLTWWVNDSSRLRGTCLNRDGGGRCIESRVTIPYSGADGISDPDTGVIQVLVPINGVNAPFFNSLVIKNSDNVVVPVDANGTDNHICEGEFRHSGEPRKVRFEAVVGDHDGFADINKVEMRYNGTVYPMSIVTGAGTTAVYRTDQTFNIGTNINLAPISIYTEDDSGHSNIWNSNRNFEVWNCSVAISGTVYDGSDAPFGIPNCATRVGLSNPYTGGFGLVYERNGGAGSAAFESVYGVSDKTMSVSGADYNSGGNSLVWGESYQPAFSGIAGGDPTMCVGNAAAANANTVTVNPYNPSAMVADFSAVLNQSAWYQVEGGNIRASIRVTNNIPVTCTDPDGCTPAMCAASSSPPMTNGMVQSPTIENNSGCGLSSGNCSYGKPNNWYWDEQLSENTYGYDYWLDQLVTKTGLAQVSAGTTWSAMVAAGQRTGIYLIDGNLTIDSNNTLTGTETLMVVVRGGVEVLPAVDNWQGIVVAEGNIVISGASANQLRLGGVYYSSGDSILVSRTYENAADNNISPAVVFSYKPGLIFNLPTGITRVISGFTSN